MEFKNPTNFESLANIDIRSLIKVELMTLNLEKMSASIRDFKTHRLNFYVELLNQLEYHFPLRDPHMRMLQEA